MRKVIGWCALPFLLAAPPALARETGGLFIANAAIVDGSGAAARAGAVRAADGRIACVGRCRAAPGDARVDAGGLVLAPGFIDTHSHHDAGLDAQRDAAPVTAQGVTTIVAGQDGFSAVPIVTLFDRFAAAPAAVNIAAYVGHGSVRAAVMGGDAKRAARPDEIARMVALVAEAMDSGAIGLSTGLEYDPAIYSTRAEVLALARAAAARGGRYISHMRSEDVGLDEAIDELLAIGRATGMPVQISHLKIAMVDRWGEAAAILLKLDAARAAGIDVTADVYPYTWWHSGLDVLLPTRDFTDLKAAQFALDHLAKPEDMILSRFPPDPSLVGRTIADVASARGVSAAEAFLALNREAAAKGEGSGVMARSMAEEDVATLIGWRHANICSDGAMNSMHPRGAGAFPRIFAWLVRGRGQLSLEQAVHKMTGLAAQHMGFADRGRIAPGMAADLVLFDPATIADTASFAEPGAAPVGIRTVWVNGVAVMRDGVATGAMPGQVIRRAPALARN
ncbi:N-acyl-D-amino-acid deacylase family protein [Sphingomonas flavalba]|uniref:N-acyl-D-amino-acid deacylase family protein n=1 Tax=Sphingomonas flavalba TaxID=2559804 RepID=UPI0039DF512B